MKQFSCEENCEVYFTIICVKYYSDNFAPKTKLQNRLLLLEWTCHYIELEPAEIKNAKTLIAFWKEVNVSKTNIFCWITLTSKFMFRIEELLSKTFLKKTISIVSIHLHYLGGCIRQIIRADLTLPPFRKRIRREYCISL